MGAYRRVGAPAIVHQLIAGSVIIDTTERIDPHDPETIPSLMGNPAGN